MAWGPSPGRAGGQGSACPRASASQAAGRWWPAGGFRWCGLLFRKAGHAELDPSVFYEGGGVFLKI